MTSRMLTTKTMIVALATWLAASSPGLWAQSASVDATTISPATTRAATATAAAPMTTSNTAGSPFTANDSADALELAPSSLNKASNWLANANAEMNSPSNNTTTGSNTITNLNTGTPSNTNSSGTASGNTTTSPGWTDPAAIADNATQPDTLSSSLEILLLMTVLSLAPAILVMTTCFTRIVVVLALMRQAMATNQLPPSQVITGLALFMSLCVMAPTWHAINQDAIQPYVNPQPGQPPLNRGQVWNRAKTHMRRFMIEQIENTGNGEDVYMFMEFDPHAKDLQDPIRNGTLEWKDVATTTLIPAFITSELKQAFVMGFYIYLPFLIIDMVIASILMSMGMMMLPPVLISMPFKLLLFVLVDGWHLVIGSLMAGFTNNPVI